MAVVNLLVEGVLDEQIGIRLIAHAGHEFGYAYGKKGWGWIRTSAAGFSKTCRATGMNYLAIVDLAGPPEPCAPELVASWLQHSEPGMLLRVAVAEVESWLLADDAGISSFLRIAKNRVGTQPDMLADPKQHLINLARRSRAITAQGLVPENGASASEGRLYTSNLSSFVRDTWDVDFACTQSPSLDRCVTRLKELPK